MPLSNLDQMFVRHRTEDSAGNSARCLMLYEFLNSNRHELLKRCREKVASRFQANAIPPAIEHGVPLLLQQLIDMLRIEQLGLPQDAIESEVHLSSAEIGRTAAIHGVELLRQGFTIEQVVREYGDVCQSVTELAVERGAQVSTDEFRTLNRCLDDAIADAVASYGNSRQSMINDRSGSLHSRLDAFEEEHRRLVEVATRAFSAIKSGNVGLSGATGTLLLHAISELNRVAEVFLPEIRRVLATVAVKPAT